MSFELKSPENERAAIQVPKEISNLNKPFSGT
ncbi:MAG TPA: class I SAM-dependent methyltransferase, partial [Planctomycetaceae bacterium]|nr:class I SAM-dependent methyltransferase [Planctomycetaceae bacterium]HCI72661.1 class I SAM-dependent methyltransferase [Balneola sp.]